MASLSCEDELISDKLASAGQKELGVGLKAVWYAAEQFGNVVGLRNKKQRTTAPRAPTEVHFQVSFGVPGYSLALNEVTLTTTFRHWCLRSKDDKTASVGQHQM